MDAGRHGVYHVLTAGLLPLSHGAHSLDRLVAGVDLAQRLIVPLHDDLLGLGLVGLLHHHLDKLRLVEAGIDHDLLVLLDVQAAADKQLGIFSQDSFLHAISAPFIDFSIF